MQEFSSGAEQDTDAPQDAPAEQPPVEFGFKLDKAEFHCALRTDADSLIEWSEFASAALDSDLDADSIEGVALTSKLLKLAMPNGEYRRFRAHLRVHKTQPDVLIRVLQYINEEMRGAVARRTERPTVQPSPSSGGEPAEGTRTAKLISLGKGDVQVVPEGQVAVPQDHKNKKPARGRPRTGTGG